MRTAFVVPTWLSGLYLDRSYPFIEYYLDVLKVTWDIILLDNGSDIDAARALLFHFGKRVQMIRFPKAYTRGGGFDYPYAWRACYFARPLLREFEYEKVVLVESDFVIVSQRMLRWIESLDSGWSTVWSAIYGFPESAFQVITPCSEFFSFTAGDFREHNGRIMEHTLPFTNVNRELVGDRYSEKGLLGIPAGCDFVAQIKLDDLRRLVH